MGYLNEAMERDSRIAVVGIAGPGDPFAEPDRTLETLRRVRESYPEMLLCVASNGLNVAPYAQDLAAVGTSHVTITVNAIDSAVAAEIYAWVRHKKRVYRGLDAGKVMLEQQMEAVRALKKHDLVLKINTIVIPGINEDHVLEVARAMKGEGADILNLMPLCNVPGTSFEKLGEFSEKKMNLLRKKASMIIAQMMHCQRCRADAVGLIHEEIAKDLMCCLQKAAAGPIEPDQERPYVAVASMEGQLVNQHLGEARALWIFRENAEDKFEALEMRKCPGPGGGDMRWKRLASMVSDCRVLLCSGAGEPPQKLLRENGVEVVVMEGLVEDALRSVYNGEPVRAPLRRHSCGAGCGGDGTGCG
jgi:nitrogen fixation protein NifB